MACLPPWLEELFRVLFCGLGDYVSLGRDILP